MAVAAVKRTFEELNTYFSTSPSPPVVWKNHYCPSPLPNQLVGETSWKGDPELERKSQELEGKIYELEQKNQELERKNWELEHITQENTLLKRAVVVQHERLEQCNNKEQEIKHLKDKLTTVEVNNYTLSMHLNQALQRTSILANSNFHPDVF